MYGEGKYLENKSMWLAGKKEKEEIFGEVFGLWRKRKMEKEKVESICEGKCLVGGGGDKRRRKWREISQNRKNNMRSSQRKRK